MRRTNLVVRRLTPNKGERAGICAFGDLHLGSAQCDEAAVRANVQECLDKKRYVIGMGDYMETALKDSVSNVYTQTMTPEDQIDAVIELFRPLADAGLLLGLLDGNHEHRINKATSLNMVKMVCHALKVPYLGHSAFMLLRVGGESYTFYATHGSSGARLAWSKLRVVMDIYRYIDAEVILHGHLHQLDHITSEYFGIDKRSKTVKTLSRHGVLTGAYLKYGGYGERKNYPPTKIGSPIIMIWGDKHKIHVSV